MWYNAETENAPYFLYFQFSPDVEDGILLLHYAF